MSVQFRLNSFCGLEMHNIDVFFPTSKYINREQKFHIDFIMDFTEFDFFTLNVTFCQIRASLLLGTMDDSAKGSLTFRIFYRDSLRAERFQALATSVIDAFSIYTANPSKLTEKCFLDLRNLFSNQENIIIFVSKQEK